MEKENLFEQAMKRPSNYHQLEPSIQWKIDKELGILDWDGTCIHNEKTVCEECTKKYYRKHKV